MRAYEKKARAARGTERTGNRVDTDIITPQDIECAGNEWYNMLYRHEVQTLIAAHCTAHEIAVYAALTHWEKTPNKVYCVPATKLSADTGLSVTAVYKALSGLQRKGIIESVRKPTKGQAAAYKVHGCVSASPTENGQRYAENEVSPTRNGQRYDEKSVSNELSPTRNGQQNPYPPTENGQLKEHIKNNGAGPLTVPAETRSMSIEEKRRALGIPSPRKRKAGGAA